MIAEQVVDFSRNFKKHYNTKDKRMQEAVKLTQQILLGGLPAEQAGGVGVETRSMKKASAKKTSEKKDGRPLASHAYLGADPTCKRLFGEDGEPVSAAEAGLLLDVGSAQREAEGGRGSCGAARYRSRPAKALGGRPRLRRRQIPAGG